MKRVFKKIAGNWWVKVLSQKIIGLLPGRLGSTLNLKLASFLQGQISERPTAGIYRIKRSVRNLQLIREHTGRTLDSMRVLEIGTGWRGSDPILFVLCGACEVTTVDHAKWLTLDSLRHSVDMIQSSWVDIKQEVDHHTPDSKSRMDTIAKSVHSALSLEDALERLNIHYFIRSDADPTSLGLQPGSIDLFYSESVLQRVPEPKLRRYASTVFGQFMKKGGGMFHRIDQRDIHTLQHVGNNDWALSYLKFPEWIFQLFLNGRFISQNRLRESDFIDIFKTNGISLHYIESRRHKDDLERVVDTRFARRFQNKAPEDIATRCSILIGTFGGGTKSQNLIRELVVGGYDDIEA